MVNWWFRLVNDGELVGLWWWISQVVRTTDACAHGCRCLTASPALIALKLFICLHSHPKILWLYDSMQFWNWRSTCRVVYNYKLYGMPPMPTLLHTNPDGFSDWSLAINYDLTSCWPQWSTINQLTSYDQPAKSSSWIIINHHWPVSMGLLAIIHHHYRLSTSLLITIEYPIPIITHILNEVYHYVLFAAGVGIDIVIDNRLHGEPFLTIHHVTYYQWNISPCNHH